MDISEVIFASQGIFLPCKVEGKNNSRRCLGGAGTVMSLCQKYPQYCWEFHDQLWEALSGTTSEKRGAPSRTGGERILEMLWKPQMPWTIGFGASQPYSRKEFQETLWERFREIPEFPRKRVSGLFHRNFSGISSGKSQPYRGCGPLWPKPLPQKKRLEELGFHFSTWSAANGGVTNWGSRGAWPPVLEIGQNRPFSPFFCLFRPFPEGPKSTWKIQKTEEKGLLPQISSDLLKPPSLKPPFAALQSTLALPPKGPKIENTVRSLIPTNNSFGQCQTPP